MNREVPVEGHQDGRGDRPSPGGVRDVRELLSVMRRLRDRDGGCPWDIEQTFASIAPYTIEEAYEVADAIERGDLDDLRDELGDLLLQVVFHAQMAAEQGAFEFADVVGSIVDKMVRRHPHVFGDTTFADTAAMKVHWEQLKAEERSRKSVSGADEPVSALDGIAVNLPALVRAEKVQKRAARVGFDWPTTAPVFDKVGEELDEVREATQSVDAAAVRDEIGDLLFAAVNLARHHQVDAESALREATLKFDRRFRSVEALAAERTLDLQAMAVDELDALWNEVKRTSEG